MIICVYLEHVPRFNIHNLNICDNNIYIIIIIIIIIVMCVCYAYEHCAFAVAMSRAQPLGSTESPVAAAIPL
jgi:hypothetical protein